MPDQDDGNEIKNQESPDDPLHLLAKRVDLLEIASHEKQRPWYTQPSTVVAIVALLVSLGTTMYTQRASKQETIRSKKEELRKLTLNLIEIRQSMLKGIASPDGPDSQAGPLQQLLLQSSKKPRPS